ncbi:hypothetical protein [Streptomyces sp. NPDC052496]|uniref:hypothetical protein n=1 Tax=Streptomyces sp. NPDC052496 TaxID=3154951 RepID=UPI003428186B
MHLNRKHLAAVISSTVLVSLSGASHVGATSQGRAQQRACGSQLNDWRGAGGTTYHAQKMAPKSGSSVSLEVGINKAGDRARVAVNGTDWAPETGVKVTNVLGMIALEGQNGRLRWKLQWPTCDKAGNVLRAPNSYLNLKFDSQEFWGDAERTAG